MAARDGEFRDGVYYFQCEACGRATTAKRGHARACSAACGARIRRQSQPEKLANSVASEGPLSFYVSLSKLRGQLAELENSGSPQTEMVVGIERPGRRTELAKLEIERVDGDEGGLVCRVGAPYTPFGATPPLDHQPRPD